MISKMKGILCLILTIGLCWTASVQAQTPLVEAPAHPDRHPAFYVFGKQGAVQYGKEDSMQVVFLKVPAEAGTVTVYLFDPGSGGNNEPASSLTGSNTITTAFTVYGGAGAYTGSQTVRPAGTQQAGNVLTTLTTTNDHRNRWVPLGPYDTQQGEVIGGHSYFKIVAEGMDGSGGNFFRVGSSARGTEIFAFDATLHLSKDNNQRTSVWVEVPAGTAQVIEENYDLDEGGIPYFAGQKLQPATSGNWLRNTINAPASNQTVRVLYEIDRTGKQAYSNGGFHFTDGNGQPLRMFFNPADAQPPPPKMAPPVNQQICDITTDLMHLRQAMPGEAYLNQELTYTITISAKTDVANVVVSDRMGENVRYVRSEPAGVVQGNSLAWNIGDMDAGQTMTISVTVVPTAEGMVRSCAVISADPRCCVAVHVGTPKLAITKTGPETALLGENVTYNVTVTNSGTAAAKDVVITDSIPAGLTHPSGQNTLKLNVGTLAPNESRTYPVTLKAAERGRHCNVAVADSSNAGQVRAEACTTVLVMGLEIAKDGTKEQFSGKVATYNITVRNTGDTALTNVVVTDTLPDRFTVLRASDNGAIAGNTVTWNMPTLGAGATQNLSLDVTTARSGELCNNVSVASREGLTASAKACTLWKGHPAMLIEVIDTIDPLMPGDETEYVIQVTNQGTADDHNVRVTINFPAQISAVSSRGDTQTTTTEKRVTVQPVAALAPKAMVEWRVRAKAVTAGDSRLSVDLESDLLRDPVTEEESTMVY